MKPCLLQESGDADLDGALPPGHENLIRDLELTTVLAAMAAGDDYLLGVCRRVLLTGLHEPAAIGALKSLAQRHDCIVLQFRDPAERGLTGAGWMRIREAETGRTVVSRGGVAWSRQEDVADELRRGAVD